jgi:hypothetical protein
VAWLEAVPPQERLHAGVFPIPASAWELHEDVCINLDCMTYNSLEGFEVNNNEVIDTNVG